MLEACVRELNCHSLQGLNGHRGKALINAVIEAVSTSLHMSANPANLAGVVFPTQKSTLCVAVVRPPQ